MPDAITSPSAPVPTAAASGGVASGFADLLRAVGSTETVNLGAMVSARIDGKTPLVPATAGSSLGLGAMTKAAATGGATAVARPLSGDAATTDRVVRFALAQQGKPYVFGTKGPDTYDCSGLVSAAYSQVGIEIPAYTFTQATHGRAIDPAAEPIKPGDLIFVRGGRPPSDLGHVGIAISATEWVQAPRTGDVVKTGAIPTDRIQVVRRIVG